MKHDSRSPKRLAVNKTQINTNILEDFITSCSNKADTYCYFNNEELRSIMTKNNMEEILSSHSHSEMDRSFSKLITEKRTQLKSNIDTKYLRFIYSKGLALVDQKSESEFEQNLGIEYVDNSEKTLTVEDLRYRNNNDKRNFFD